MNPDPVVKTEELINPPTQVEVPDPITASAPSIAGASTIADAAENEITRIDTEESRQRDDILNILGDAPAQNTSRLRADSNEANGVNSIREQLSAENLRLTSLVNSFDSIDARIQSAQGQSSVRQSAQLGQLNRERAVEVKAQAAIVTALQGNYALASQQANQAVQDAQADRKAHLDQLDAQYDRLSGIVDEETQQVLNLQAEERQVERDFLKQVSDNVSAAVASGVASQAEIAQLTNANTSDEQKMALSQAIQARGSSETRSLERQRVNAQIRSSMASANSSEYELSVAQDAEIRRQEMVAAGILTPDQAETVDEIDKQFRSEPIVKDYNTAVAKQFAAQEVLENGVKGVGDLLVVYEFMKSVDPTSVVRESEFDNAAKTGNIFAGQLTKFNEGYFGEGGFLPADVKDSFLGAMNASFEGKQTQYFNLQDEFGEKVNRRLGIDTGASFLTAYENGAPASDVASQDPEGAAVGAIIESNRVRYRKLPDGTLIEL